jgi:two-component system CheB/CheR fusion protein
MFTAVAFVVWRSGWGPALGTALGGWVAAGLVFRGGLQFFGRLTFNEVVGLGVYMLACGSIIVLGEAMRRAQKRLLSEQDTLSSTNLALENKVEAQSLLAAIVASSQDAIVSKTLDGIITSWNKGAERLFGYTAEEAIGQSIHLIVPPDLRDQERDILGRLRRGERVEHLDVERVRKDGSRIHISVAISPVYDRHGHIIGASKTARDITVRKEWEQTLLRSEEALRNSRDVVAMAMTAGRMGAWTRDLVTNRAWWSSELAEILGIAQTAGEAEQSRLAGLIHPDDQAAVGRTVDEAIAKGVDYAAEFRFHHAPSGEWRWMEARGKASYGADGKPVMLFGLGIDITDRRRALEALQEADRRKDEFLATLAHELRNPLAPIASGLHILRAADGKSEAAAAARTIMERQVRQMVRLVDDLLDVARITTGKIELRCEPIDLADAIGDAIETSRPTMASRGQRFSTDFPTEPIYVNADRTRLAQVFANLLNNSAKYSEPEQPITIAVTRDGGDAVVRVRDDGIGIHAEMLPRVFEMFRQADRTGGRSRGGLGIGLSLVKRIVEMHHGTVTAASAGLGQGSEFTVRLPAIAATRAAAPKQERPSAAMLSKRRVLVVDDNEDAAESLAALLQINGHETRLAHDGPDAVEQARRFHPDVVFLDIGMPMVDGHETARRIRQQPWGKDMVLVALTGWGQVEDRRRSKEAGFNHHLVKPADPAVVTKLLSEIPLAS